MSDHNQKDRLLSAIASHSPVSWAHINLLGEYDFSDEKLKDSVGIQPPKIAVCSDLENRGCKISVKWVPVANSRESPHNIWYLYAIQPIYMQAALELLRQSLKIKEDDEAGLSPLTHAHINILGHYTFNLSEQIKKGELRPLNKSMGNSIP